MKTNKEIQMTVFSHHYRFLKRVPADPEFFLQTNILLLEDLKKNLD